MDAWLRPTSLADALAALAAAPRVILAGGTDLYPSHGTSSLPGSILDISALPGLRRIETHADHWRIPCLATWSDVIGAELPASFDGLRAAARQIGGVQVQNAATVIGNVCNASPAADGIPNLLALDATVELASLAGTRHLALADFVLGNRRTARRPDELAVALRIPRPAGPARGVFEKLGARRYLVISITMVAAVAEYDAAGRVRRARIAVGACGPRAVRLPGLEAALEGRQPEADFVTSHLVTPHLITGAHLAPLAPIDDVRASAEYRLRATAELLRRALDALGTPRARAA